MLDQTLVARLRRDEASYVERDAERFRDMFHELLLRKGLTAVSKRILKIVGHQSPYVNG
jgi:hypothetical protein